MKEAPDGSRSAPDLFFHHRRDCGDRRERERDRLVDRVLLGGVGVGVGVPERELLAPAVELERLVAEPEEARLGGEGSQFILSPFKGRKNFPGGLIQTVCMSQPGDDELRRRNGDGAVPGIKTAICVGGLLQGCFYHRGAPLLDIINEVGRIIIGKRSCTPRPHHALPRMAGWWGNSPAVILRKSCGARYNLKYLP